MSGVARTYTIMIDGGAQVVVAVLPESKNQFLTVAPFQAGFEWRIFM